MNIAFSPLLPLPLIVALALAATLLVGWALFGRMRGALLRALALAALVLALANPVANFEEREPVTSIVAIVVDRSPSQMSLDRTARTDAALKALTERLARYPAFETRIIEAVTDPDAQSPSTQLFEALASGIRDVPSSRLAGAVMITDGQVHDVPDSLAALGLDAPLHGLIVGDENEVDRRIDIVRSPRFGIVGEDQEIVYRVSDDGAAQAPAAVPVTIRVNGEEIAVETANTGQDTSFYLDLPRGGENIVELSVEVIDDEVTPANNRAVVLVEGIRENLRVLLVSGEPHAGERAWRNLLKSDAAVDLVHFTILRPPEKQDGTPISELSLIAFPTRELFVEKIDEFDLIIFDRYQNRGVLPVLYYDYIARYVEEGGALLVAAGPELAGAESIAETPLAPALPALPTGDVTLSGFYPRLSDDGRRHPVTRDLPGGGDRTARLGPLVPHCGRARHDRRRSHAGRCQGQPLLVLNRYGEGRVAMLLSDHGWLWARGFEGGGPHVALYRRIAHWLMQEPSLEEEAVRATALGRTLRIERQTMSDDQRPRNGQTAVRRGPRRYAAALGGRSVHRRTGARRTRPGGSHLGRSERARPCWRGRCPGIPRHRFNYRQPRPGGGTERRACRTGQRRGHQPAADSADPRSLGKRRRPDRPSRKQRKRTQGCERGAVVRWIFGIGAADPGSGRNLVPGRPLAGLPGLMTGAAQLALESRVPLVLK
jgi:hypothetical protein